MCFHTMNDASGLRHKLLPKLQPKLKGKRRYSTPDRPDWQLPSDKPQHGLRLMQGKLSEGHIQIFVGVGTADICNRSREFQRPRRVKQDQRTPFIPAFAYQSGDARVALRQRQDQQIHPRRAGAQEILRHVHVRCGQRLGPPARKQVSVKSTSSIGVSHATSVVKVLISRGVMRPSCCSHAQNDTPLQLAN